ncbi:MAG TPA: co-chaperone DjlA [Thiotrichaceae bacterium]|jgi:DnaJ like chaperone protein|nr:co-chaperone DjlA [Thiotrichaceae bacterium]HIM07519.1 co-chaperone DjlA [Gammaproteobacteria bacterium]
MNWWGKILGGTFGMMFGGPIGAVLGAALGHNFDKGMEQPAGQSGFGRQERAQTMFYTATFSVMGHVCKADGQVTADEIALAKQVMQQMDMDAEQRKGAINLFNEGKKDSFPLNDVVRQFRQEIGFRANLLRMFIEVQIMAAYADGVMDPAERTVLLNICQILRISQHEFEHLCAMISGMHSGSSQAGRNDGSPSLKQAYAVLDIDESANKSEIKRAYRRLLSQHHPDKLVAKGLPEEMMKIATDRTHEIRKAYEVIKKAKQFK